MKEDTASIEALFRKYLKGEHSGAELDELLRYFDMEEDSGFLRGLIQRQLQQQRFSDEENHRIDLLVGKVEPKLFAEVGKVWKLRRRTVYRRWAGIAASLLVFVTIGLGLYFYPSIYPRDGVPGVAGVLEDALPGGNRATLSLEDGSIISLSEERAGIVTVSEGFTYEDGTVVRELSGSLTEVPVAQYALLATPNGGTYQVTLPDGSQVWLNAASTLRYPTVFSGGERKIELTGEAYFDVAHNPSQPFRVEVNGTTIEVLGTEFNIHAYSDLTTTTLIDGSVKVSNGQSQYRMLPGEQSYFDGLRFVVQQADIDKVIAWKDGKFYFKKDNMVEIMDQLARWYDLEVEYHGELPVITGYSGHISRYVNLSEVLEMLRFVSAADFAVADHKIHVFFDRQ